MPDNRKDASKATMLANQESASHLPFDDDTETFINAQRGFQGTWEHVVIQKNGTDIWNLDPYKDQTLGSDPPPTVHPSLWRQACLNSLNGVFKIAEGFYQVRAFDMSNMTVIEAPDGLIVIDPLISTECAEQAMRLYRENRPQHARTPIVAVIYTHSHADHFGGVRGVITDDIVDDVEIYAPDGFLEHAVSENVYAGVAMWRRAQYMYGPYLTPDNKGQVDGGLGKGQSTGTVSLIPPTHVIKRQVADLEIAGMQVVFQLTPGAEAPAEMNFYFPVQDGVPEGILCGAENLTQNMHNLQTLRGAQVRDPLAWSRYLNEALKLFGEESAILFNQHHWPVWGNDKVSEFIRRQRDMYRYFNDQSLRMLNKGYTGIEIAEVFKMPPGVDRSGTCRGYYGTVSHNTKAVYDRYMGWFNGNPCDLHTLPPAQTASKYVELMGGGGAVYSAADSAFQTGQYRWAAELLKHLVFAEPENQSYKDLLADTLEQLGYQSEAATWRNFYLVGAQELRDGIAEPEEMSSSEDMTTAMTNEMLFDAFAARLVGPKAVDYSMTQLWTFTGGTDTIDLDDVQERRIVEISNGALSHIPLDGADGDDRPDKFDIFSKFDVSITLTRPFLDRLMLGQLSLQEILDSDAVQVEKGLPELIDFFSLLEDGVTNFPIVTPRPDAEAAWLGASPKDSQSSDTLQRRRRFLLKMPRGC